MASYYLIFLWLGLMAMLEKSPQFNEIVLVDDKEEIRKRFIFAFIVFLPICIMTMNRGSTIGDIDGYFLEFRFSPSTMSNIGDYLATVDKDKGFAFLEVFIRSFITQNVKIYALIIALIQGICLVSVYRKYSTRYVFSIFLFFASTDMVSWMCNGIRQGLAAFIIFAATPLMLKKKYMPLLVVILLASTLHMSALIMIFFVVIASNKAWNKKTVLFIIGIIAAVFFVSRFTNLLNDILAETQYSNSVAEGAAGGGTNYLRVLVYAIPTIIAFVFRERIKVFGDPTVDFCINMSIISTGMYVFSIFAGGITFGRLPIYASLYNYVLLPWEIDNLFGNKGNIAIIIVVTCYFLFYLYQMRVAWGFL